MENEKTKEERKGADKKQIQRGGGRIQSLWEENGSEKQFKLCFVQE